MDNIAAAATQTAANGGPLAELASSMEIKVDTVARHQQDIKRFSEQISALKKKGTSVTGGATVLGGDNLVCKHCESVGRTAPHRRNSCYFDPRKNPDRKDLARQLMEEKRVKFNDEWRWGTAKTVVHKPPNKENLMYEASLIFPIRMFMQ